MTVFLVIVGLVIIVVVIMVGLPILSAVLGVAWITVSTALAPVVQMVQRIKRKESLGGLGWLGVLMVGGVLIFIFVSAYESVKEKREMEALGIEPEETESILPSNIAAALDSSTLYFQGMEAYKSSIRYGNEQSPYRLTEERLFFTRLPSGNEPLEDQAAETLPKGMSLKIGAPIRRGENVFIQAEFYRADKITRGFAHFPRHWEDSVEPFDAAVVKAANQDRYLAFLKKNFKFMNAPEKDAEKMREEYPEYYRLPELDTKNNQAYAFVVDKKNIDLARAYFTNELNRDMYLFQIESGYKPPDLVQNAPDVDNTLENARAKQDNYFKAAGAGCVLTQNRPFVRELIADAAKKPEGRLVKGMRLLFGEAIRYGDTVYMPAVYYIKDEEQRIFVLFPRHWQSGAETFDLQERREKAVPWAQIDEYFKKTYSVIEAPTADAARMEEEYGDYYKIDKLSREKKDFYGQKKAQKEISADIEYFFDNKNIDKLIFQTDRGYKLLNPGQNG
ncbi:MAG: hypothetical protein LBQ57_04710 [Spirochaetales bacterium]|jgi:hypothetical protein|nr:hypothetical protein [Spirochaetales bacterium]